MYLRFRAFKGCIQRFEPACEPFKEPDHTPSFSQPMPIQLVSVLLSVAAKSDNMGTLKMELTAC